MRLPAVPQRGKTVHRDLLRRQRKKRGFAFLHAISETCFARVEKTERIDQIFMPLWV
jgi:hypothetical protein